MKSNQILLIILIFLKFFLLTLCLVKYNFNIQFNEFNDIFYNDFQYKEAIKEYEAALIKERTFKNEAHLLTHLAYSYMYTFQYAKAEQTFLQLVKLGDKKPAPEVYLDYGNILKI